MVLQVLLRTGKVCGPRAKGAKCVGQSSQQQQVVVVGVAAGVGTSTPGALGVVVVVVVVVVVGPTRVAGFTRLVVAKAPGRAKQLAARVRRASGPQWQLARLHSEQKQRQPRRSESVLQLCCAV